MTDSYEIELLIADFLRAFDAHDWVGMRLTLADELRIDFATPRGGRPTLLSVNPDSFVRQRRNSLSDLEMTHTFDLESLRIGDGTAEARCKFAIKRFAHGGERHFHSWGEYCFEFVKMRRGWKISAIAQMTWRTDGDAKLHSARTEQLIA
ncbi:MAG: nuclear transport factor 2 family protein [Solirubrobacterales bacterium]